MALLSQLQTVITLLVVLSILVVAHEWGHFIVARLFGVRVDDFSIGFGKRLVRLGKRGDTEYNLRMLPFGGFVKIAGMAADEEPLVRAKDKVMGNNDPDAREVPLLAENIDHNTADSAAPPAPDEFGSKALYQRVAIIFAGPLMSFVTGYVILCLIGVTLGWPSGALLNKVDQVEPGGEGQRIGLRGGDVITAINGSPITSGNQMVGLIHHSEGKPLTLTVKRGFRTLSLTGTPRPLLDDDNKPVTQVDIQTPGALGPAFGAKSGDVLAGINDTSVRSAAQVGTLLNARAGKKVTLVVIRDGQGKTLDGVVPKLGPNTGPALESYVPGIFKFDPQTSLERTGFVNSVKDGSRATVFIFSTLAHLVQRHQLQNNAGGIIMMYQATNLAVQNNALKPSSLFKTVELMAQLSISLAIFNLLPIPVLDGGHLLAFFIEWIRRGKKMTEQQQQAFLMTGLAIIGTLFVLIMTHDIIRTLKHQLPQ